MENLLGKRVLVSSKNGISIYSPTSLEEIKILELSPSGKYVKIMNLNGRKFWKIKTELTIVEPLDSEERPKN